MKKNDEYWAIDEYTVKQIEPDETEPDCDDRWVWWSEKVMEHGLKRVRVFGGPSYPSELEALEKLEEELEYRREIALDRIADLKTPKQVKTICSWCKALIHDGETIDGRISHGICEPCAAEMEEDENDS